VPGKVSPRAACTLVRRPSDGHILAITRGEDVRDWGLPGGRAERFERFADTAARELTEETGVRISRGSRLVPVWIRETDGSQTAIFEVDGSVIIPSKLESNPFEGYVDWLPPEEMCRPTCTFGAFQHELFRRLGIL